VVTASVIKLHISSRRTLHTAVEIHKDIQEQGTEQGETVMATSSGSPRTSGWAG
jgi:hypothetical protein